MTTHDPNSGPCRPMRSLLDAAADGRRRGLRAWYARAHATQCPGCRRYLESLQGMIQRLRQSAEVEDGAAIERLAKRLAE